MCPIVSAGALLCIGSAPPRLTRFAYERCQPTTAAQSENYRPGSVARKVVDIVAAADGCLAADEEVVCLFACLSVCPSFCLSFCPSVCPLSVPLFALPLSFGRTFCGMLHAAGNYRWATIGSLSRFLFKLRNVLSTICPLIYAQHCRGRAVDGGRGHRGRGVAIS